MKSLNISRDTEPPQFIKDANYPALEKNVGEDSTDIWINNNLRFCSEAEIYLQEVYDYYKIVFKAKKLIPDTKIAFSRKIRGLLKEDIKTGKVKYVRRSRYLLRGVLYIDVDSPAYFSLGIPQTKD